MFTKSVSSVIFYVVFGSIFLGCSIKSEVKEGIYTLKLPSNDTTTINDIINKKFVEDFSYSFYSENGSYAYWIKLPIENSDTAVKNFYFVFRYAYARNADFWLQKKDTIVKGHHHSHLENLKTPRLSNFPTWRFSLEPNERAYAFFRIVSSGYRKEFLLTDEEGFEKFKLWQIISMVSYAVIIILFSVIISILAFSTKQWYVLFYSAYLLLFIVDYGALNGFFQTYIWPNVPYLINSGRSISHLLITFFASLFYARFYKQRGAPKWVNYYFLFLVSVMSVFMIGYIIKLFDDGLTNLFLYLWSFLNYNFVLIFLVHVYLGFKNIIPRYLSFIFLLPIAANMIRNGKITDMNTEPFLIRLVDSGYFICLVIELSIFSLFLIREILKGYRGEMNVLEKEKASLKTMVERKLSDIKKIHLASSAVLSTNKIIFIKSDGHYLEFFLEDKERPEIDRNKIKEILDLLPFNFVRIHKSYIVNTDFIKSKHATKVVLVNNIELPVSRTFRIDLEDSLKKVK